MVGALAAGFTAELGSRCTAGDHKHLSPFLGVLQDVRKKFFI